jgi:hypothetical protein
MKGMFWKGPSACLKPRPWCCFTRSSTRKAKVVRRPRSPSLSNVVAESESPWFSLIMPRGQEPSRTRTRLYRLKDNSIVQFPDRPSREKPFVDRDNSLIRDSLSGT